MRAAISPRAHVFVCANRRDGSPLGPGCSEHGDVVYDAMKTEVGKRRLVADVWVTKTHCLGICPKHGATVARYPGFAEPIVTEVETSDVPAIFDAIDARARAGEERDGGDWDAIERELVALEELQTKKVLDLARRLKPGLTLEDVQNPHDFPELDDSDWHYADGILTGVKSVVSALRAMRGRERGR